MKLAALEITALVPDQIIRVSLDDSVGATITVKDTTNGEQRTVETTPLIAGIMLLALIAGDEAVSSIQYGLLETVFSPNEPVKWPLNLRPIP